MSSSLVVLLVPRQKVMQTSCKALTTLNTHTLIRRQTRGIKVENQRLMPSHLASKTLVIRANSLMLSAPVTSMTGLR